MSDCHRIFLVCMSMSFVSVVQSKYFPLRTISPHTSKCFLTYITQVSVDYFNHELTAMLVQQLFATDNIKPPQHSHKDAESRLYICVNGPLYFLVHCKLTCIILLFWQKSIAGVLCGDEMVTLSNTIRQKVHAIDLTF